jgi:hypothetical protein
VSEVRLPAPVKATLVDDTDNGVPGAFEFANYQGEVAGIIYVCPCGCGSQGYLRLRGAPRPPEEAGRPSWIWDGNREAPTLDPSVHHVGHWHGYLRAGFWTQA